jgi:hypothetical protein
MAVPRAALKIDTKLEYELDVEGRADMMVRREGIRKGHQSLAAIEQPRDVKQPVGTPTLPFLRFLPIDFLSTFAFPVCP